jgi:hypothetical protein
MAEAPDPIKAAEITLRLLETRVRTLSSHLDMLYNKGKADGWPKEVMNYIMWFEHEVCRLPQTMPREAEIIRKGLRHAAQNKNSDRGLTPE